MDQVGSGIISKVSAPTSPTVVAITYEEGATTPGIEDAVRSVLAAALGTPKTRPLLGQVPRGGTVVIKPNMVRHWNPSGSLAAVITSPLIVQILIELASEEVGGQGRVIVGDSPQNDCDFDALLNSPEWASAMKWKGSSAAPPFDIVDFRPESVTMKDGVIVERRQLQGDPCGEHVVDLGPLSAFTDSTTDPSLLRGSDYDKSVTVSSHAGGRHVYSLCRTFLDADLLIVVPKVKTHKKVGLSLAMKNLVGLVGEKNCLPHHAAGFPDSGGDEFPVRSLWPRMRHVGAERARTLLAHGRGVTLLRALRRIEAYAPQVPVRSGNWWGNDTAWRMVLDLVQILRIQRLDRGRPTVFLYDGIVVGEGNGPLAPDPVRLGLLAACDDPVAGDIAVAGELGVTPGNVPLLQEALSRLPWGVGSADAAIQYLSLRAPIDIRMHPGWSNAQRTSLRSTHC